MTGKRVLVTGAGTGIGRGIALELARRGAAVAVHHSRSATGAAATVKEIVAGGPACRLAHGFGNSLPQYCSHYRARVKARDKRRHDLGERADRCAIPAQRDPREEQPHQERHMVTLRRIQNGRGGDPTPPLRRPPIEDGVPELEAIGRLSALGITAAALERTAREGGGLRKTSNRIVYAEAFIRDLETTYVTKEEAKRILNFTDHQLWHWLNLSGKKARLVGKVSLVRKDDVWDELRARAAGRGRPVKSGR